MMLTQLSRCTVDAGKLTVSTSISRASAMPSPLLTSDLCCNRLNHSWEGPSEQAWYSRIRPVWLGWETMLLVPKAAVLLVPQAAGLLVPTAAGLHHTMLAALACAPTSLCHADGM